MKQTACVISIHAADTSGVCSILYELGGMTVVHDASGCNSTYTTHDEPRWYRRDSMIYISALTETDAIMGRDEKLIDDISSAARDLSPRFIAICGSPLPMMIGTDFPAIASEIEARTGIPAFGLHTNGMHSYLTGASEALAALTARFCRPDVKRTGKISAGIIGASPLDFSINGSVEDIQNWLIGSGFQLVSCMAVNSSLDDIILAGSAHVNLVVSACGIAAAEFLRMRFGTPWVAGVPVGVKFAARLASAMKQSAADGKTRIPCADRPRQTSPMTAIVGESIFSGSLACAIQDETGRPCRVLCPLESDDNLLSSNDLRIFDEDAASAAFSDSAAVIADPLYAPVCPANIPLIRLPHEAFSGRCFRKEIPNLINRPLPWRF